MATTALVTIALPDRQIEYSPITRAALVLPYYKPRFSVTRYSRKIGLVVLG
jgi:hypothetical protein